MILLHIFTKSVTKPNAQEFNILHKSVIGGKAKNLNINKLRFFTEFMLNAVNVFKMTKNH